VSDIRLSISGVIALHILTIL